ncbi:hypothetical protein WJX72_002065 [[Myrmecia] bisecta]|uniref:Mitochondrial import inner membrane translocase subunit Tim21 n=1 Tax=[Myrmecia] bisecta TaxID=41462 RepID=A0AAW1P4C9_9CHLO
MSRTRAPLLVSRLLNTGAQACCRASAEQWQIYSTSLAVGRSGWPALLQQLSLQPNVSAISYTFAARPFSSSASAAESAGKPSARQQQRQANQAAARNAVAAQQDPNSAITDQIPMRPMGVVEGTSYTVLILAGLGFAAAILYFAVNELLIQPKEYTCFNTTLEKLRDDPRVTVRLGTPISGYGQESRNRAARQRIPHRVYTDQNGVERILIQFHAKGPSGLARVSADMYQDTNKDWQYAFLYVDVDSPTPQRLVLVEPRF